MSDQPEGNLAIAFHLIEVEIKAIRSVSKWFDSDPDGYRVQKALYQSAWELEKWTQVINDEIELMKE